MGDLFGHRWLFVQRDLTPAQRRNLQRITHGRPELRTLREIVEEVQRLFDPRRRTETALAKLRRRVRRFQWVGEVLETLFSPNLEKALTFLDEKPLASTCPNRTASVLGKLLRLGRCRFWGMGDKPSSCRNTHVVSGPRQDWSGQQSWLGIGSSRRAPPGGHVLFLQRRER